MLSEINQRKTNTTWSYLCMEYKQKKIKPIDRENRLVIARDRGWGIGKIVERGKKVQISSYKINKSWGYNV